MVIVFMALIRITLIDQGHVFSSCYISEGEEFEIAIVVRENTALNND